MLLAFVMSLSKQFPPKWQHTHNELPGETQQTHKSLRKAARNLSPIKCLPTPSKSLKNKWMMCWDVSKKKRGGWKKKKLIQKVTPDLFFIIAAITSHTCVSLSVMNSFDKAAACRKSISQEWDYTPDRGLCRRGSACRRTASTLPPLNFVTHYNIMFNKFAALLRSKSEKKKTDNTQFRWVIL